MRDFWNGMEEKIENDNERKERMRKEKFSKKNGRENGNEYLKSLM